MANQPTSDDVTQQPTPPAPGTIITPAGATPKASTPTGAASAPTPAAPAQASPAPSSRRRMTTFVVAGVLLVVAAGVGLAYKILVVDTAKPVVAEVKKEIANFRYGTVSTELNQLYPKTFTGIATTFDTNSQIYEGLVQLDSSYHFKPLLAESWTNPDSKTWLFTIKQNVTFHNGQTMTAEDVKKSILGAKDTYIGPFIADTVASAEVVDATHVKVTTTVPDPLLLSKFLYAFICDDSTDPAAGTGAYYPDKTMDSTHLTLLAFDKYHLGRPTTRKVTITSCKDTTACLTDYNRGDLDAIEDIDLPPENAKPAGLAKIDIFAVFMLGFNTRKTTSPLSKLAVRQAIAKSIDPEPIITASKFDATPVSQLLANKVPGYDPSIVRPTRDTAAAKALLTQAGYPNGITLTLSHQAYQIEVAKLIQLQLAEAGITVKFDEATDTDAYFKAIDAGTSEMFVQTRSTAFFDGSDVFTGVLQTVDYKSAEIDTLITQASSGFDANKRLDLLKTISRKAMEDVAALPIYQRNQLIAVQPKIHITRNSLTNGLGAYLWNAYSD